MTNGKKAFYEIGEKLKQEAAAKAAQKENTMAKATTDLEVMKQKAVAVQGFEVTAEVADMYRQTASLGMDNVSSNALPQLKVIEVNSKDRLFDGSRIKEGSLLYTPTKDVYDKVLCSILTVSKGYWSLNQNDLTTGKPKVNKDGTNTKFNQLVGGMMLTTMQPFVIFASGTRWINMNDFVKSIRPFTKHKTMPIPMYAFQVELGTELIKTNGGNENYVMTYNLVKNEKGQAQLVQDRDLIHVLVSGIETIEEQFESFIQNTEVDRFTGEAITTPIEKYHNDMKAKPAKVEIDAGQRVTYSPEPTKTVEDMAASDFEASLGVPDNDAPPF